MTIRPPMYLATLVALLLLTGLSYWTAHMHLGDWEMVVALAIAVVKGTLVILFFMHLAEQQFSNQVALMTSIAFVVILVVLVVGDIWTRGAPTVVPPAGAPTLVSPHAVAGE